MPDPFTIYREYAEQYDRLISYEDYEQRLFPALSAIRSFDQADVVEWGAGTGRVSALAAPYARSITACDASPAMLKMAARKLRQFDRLQWRTLVADHRRIPLPDHHADIALAGWTLGYLTSKYYADWPDQIARVIEQMRRVLRPGGVIIIIETLGTGSSDPQPPAPYLADYYRFLEGEHGFHQTWLRTDLQFTSLDEAAELLGFFFGAEFSDKARRNNWIITPECTGIWWKQVP